MTFIGESSFDLPPFIILELVPHKDFALDLDLDEMQDYINRENSFKLLAFKILNLVLQKVFFLDLD